MDSTPTNHAAAANLTQNNPTKTTPRDTSNPNPIAPTRPKMAKSTIDAHFATLARENSLPSSTHSDRARDVYVNRQLVEQFGRKFGMDEARAKAAVELEMKSRYAPNPWDVPGSGRLVRQRILSGGEKRVGGRSEEAGGVGRYSEEEWDVFEEFLGYK